jgi:predicted transcriptional regulator
VELELGKSGRRGNSNDAAEKTRLTVQLSSALMEAVEQRAELEAIPNAVLIRRAVTTFVRRPPAIQIEVSHFADAERTGRRGPLRQWPKGVSYVLDISVADGLERLAETRSEATGQTVSVTDLAREAIVRDLESPSVPSRTLAKDEIGFTTSGAFERGREKQSAMDDIWRSTNEE